MHLWSPKAYPENHPKRHTDFPMRFWRLLGSITEAPREPKCQYFWAYLLNEFWGHFGLHLDAHFASNKDLWSRPGGQQANLHFHWQGRRKRASGPFSTPWKCLQKMLPGKLGKRYQNDEPRGSQNDPKMAPKMELKITSILRCLGTSKTTSNDAPTRAQNGFKTREENIRKNNEKWSQNRSPEEGQF